MNTEYAIVLKQYISISTSEYFCFVHPFFVSTVITVDTIVVVWAKFGWSMYSMYAKNNLWNISSVQCISWNNLPRIIISCLLCSFSSLKIGYSRICACAGYVYIFVLINFNHITWSSLREFETEIFSRRARSAAFPQYSLKFFTLRL